MKKLDRDSRRETSKTSSSKVFKKTACVQPGYEDFSCVMAYDCKHCLCSQMGKDSYQEFIGGLNIPEGV